MITKPQNSKKRKLKRYCAICGKDLSIIVNQDKTYTGGHYFFKVETEKGNQAEYGKISDYG